MSTSRARNSVSNRHSSDERVRFPKRVRLLSPRQFKHVYEARVRKSVGPLMVYGRPNEMAFTRMGLTISRSVGGAVERNRIKRMLREAFRHVQSRAPRGPRCYDFIISVRTPHALPLEEYEELLMRAFLQIHDAWRKRMDKQNPAEAELP